MNTRLLPRAHRFLANGEKNGFGGGWIYLTAVGKVCIAHKPDFSRGEIPLARMNGRDVIRYAPRAD